MFTHRQYTHVRVYGISDQRSCGLMNTDLISINDLYGREMREAQNQMSKGSRNLRESFQDGLNTLGRVGEGQFEVKQEG